MGNGTGAIGKLILRLISASYFHSLLYQDQVQQRVQPKYYSDRLTVVLRMHIEVHHPFRRREESWV
jgi:hypothetical protein